MKSSLLPGKRCKALTEKLCRVLKKWPFCRRRKLAVRLILLTKLYVRGSVLPHCRLRPALASLEFTLFFYSKKLSSITTAIQTQVARRSQNLVLNLTVSPQTSVEGRSKLIAVFGFLDWILRSIKIFYSAFKF